MMKKILAISLMLSILFTLCACKSYRNDISVSAIENEIIKIVKNEGLTEQTELYISEIMKIDTSIFEEHIIKAPDDTSLDEYGIFKCKSSGDARDTAKKLNEYLAFRQDEWTGMYLQDEYPKLKYATVKTFGNYAVYLILEEQMQKEIYSNIEDILEK